MKFQSIMIEQLLVHRKEKYLDNDESIKLNIQFHVVSVKGIPQSPSMLTRSVPKRAVRVTCDGRHHFERRTDPDLESGASTWNENLPQMGPVVGTDKIIFSVHQYAPIPLIATEIACSKVYDINSLLDMQREIGRGDISIPLYSSSADEISEAFLVVRIQEPTADFVSKRWLEEAIRRAGQRALEEEKQSRTLENTVPETNLSLAVPSP